MESMERLKGRKILVTGGAGFIGSHLVTALLRKKAKIFVIDLRAGTKSIFALNELHKEVVFHILDIRHKNKVQNYFERFSFDYVFHLAAESLVGESYENPHRTFETNIMGTINILEAIRNKKVKGFIFASSDKAYGKTKRAYKEDSSLKGDHPYDVSKSSADLICQTYFKTYGTPVLITRFGNVYGEGDLHFDRIIPGICKAILTNKVLEIRSDGSYIRDYLYVGDVISGYFFLMKNIDKFYGEAFNFSSRDNLSVLDVVKIAEQSLDVKINYKILNNAKNEIPYQHLDDSKIKKLGWVANHSLKTSLPAVLEWYRENL